MTQHEGQRRERYASTPTLVRWFAWNTSSCVPLIKLQWYSLRLFPLQQDSRMDVEIVEALNGASSHEWDAFLGVQSRGSFYHQFAWKLINEEQLRHTTIFLEARHGSILTGILPLVLTRSRVFGHILCSMPFVNFGGPISVDDASERELIAVAKERASRLNVDYLELRCSAPLDADMAVSLQKVSMTLQLEADAEALWDRLTSKHRNNIRRVYKEGLTVRAGGIELLPEFYEVMLRSWRDLGTPLYALSYFQAILEAFPQQVRIFVCHDGGKPVATAFNGHFASTVEGMWAGTTPVGRQKNANYLLYWEMIKDACERGFNRFHLGRSTTGSGAEQFKKRWNAETTQLYWYHFRPDGKRIPVVNVDNPKFRLAIAGWRKLPLSGAKILGPPLARVIP